MQNTVREFSLDKGIGLHSGVISKLRFLPTDIDSGITFVRVDLADKPQIKATFDNVVDTVNSTNLGINGKMMVRTIEHLMCGLYMAEIDNVIIEIDNEEMPIFDGSAKVFYEALQKNKIKQNSARKVLDIKKEVVFKDDKDNEISITPYEKKLRINFEIVFPSPIIGHQMFSGDINQTVFEKEICDCRTFAEKYQVDYLQSIGLAKGGSLENAVVVEGDKILNPEGLRRQNECVNHKVLDAIGDMYTSGYRIFGKVSALRTGHFHSNKLLHKLFEDKSNFEII